ncbi:hypothetical protein A7K94_0219495 [Modestobacter sp. VKM Ac-2676]|nr:hypothetical protein A7K94_0219495 [Modestobacter sp. VKM Ac-2676]
MQPFRPQVAARLAELAPPLLDRLDAMTDRMVGILTRTDSAYAAQAPEVLLELHASIRENLERGVRTLVGGGDDGGHVALAAAREVGRRRAAQGMPLETVLRAYRLGGQVTWEEPRRATQDADAPGDSDVLLESPVVCDTSTTCSAPRWPRRTAARSGGWPASTTRRGSRCSTGC